MTSDSETKTSSAPALTLRWRVEGQHAYRFELADWREKFIGWFGLPADAADARIVEAIESARRLPSGLLMELEELGALAQTWQDARVDDVDDFEAHNIPRASA